MTKTAKHSILFRLWIHIRGLIAVLIVLLGIIVGIISLILPNQEIYKPYLINFLSQQWNKEIEIKDIAGKWQGLGPHFSISGLKIKDEDEISIDSATLNINVIKYLIPGGSTGIDLGIDDVEVELVQRSSGAITINEPSKSKIDYSKKLEEILNSATVSVNNLSLNFQDSEKNINRIHSKITVEQNQHQRAFELQLTSDELADNFVIKSIANQSHDFSKQARWYIETKNLSLQNLGKLTKKSFLPNALVNSRIWFSTEKGNIIEMSAQAEFTDKLFTSPFKNDFDILGDAELIYKGSKDNWNARLTLENIETRSIKQDKIIISIYRQSNLIHLQADTLDIPLLKAIAQTINIPLDGLEKAEINGKLTHVAISYDMQKNKIIEAKADFEKLDFNIHQAEVYQLQGQISLENELINILIDSDSGSAKFPGIIRGEVQWDKLLLTARTSVKNGNPDVQVQSVWCDCKDFILDGSARASFEDELFLDLSLVVLNAKTNQLYKYWPSFKWKPRLLDYLDTALVSGVVDHGIILYHGWAKQYPFENNEGIFLTKSSLKNATVKYQREWPEAKNFQAIVSTENRKLWVNVEQANVLNSRISKASAVITNLKKPTLDVDIYADGKDNFLLDLLKRSPMGRGLRILQQDISFHGKQNIQVNLSLPLKPAKGEVIRAVPKGKLKFSNSSFKLGNFELKNMFGALDFEGFSISLKQLKASFLDNPTSVSGDILNTPGQPSEINIMMQGTYPVSRFNSMTEFQLPAQGESEWKFHISNKSANVNEIRFTASSDLTGTEILLPAPLYKDKNDKTAFSINCLLPCEDSDWNAKFGSVINSQFSFNKESGEMKLNRLAFGNSDMQFGGIIDSLDLDKWIDILVKNKKSHAGNKLPLNQIELDIRNLIFMNRPLKDVHIKMETIMEGLKFEIDGPDVAGTVTLPEDIDNRGIIIQLEKLHWQALAEEITPQAASKISDSYPALHIWIGDFVYNGIPLGDSSIEVRPVIEGLRVEKFMTQSDLMNLNINGLWRRNQGTNGTSEFNIILTSRDIADFLAELGFSAPIKGANTIIDMQASWNDFPSRFEIGDISGKMRIEVGEGEVVDAKPGMGRILGLFSLTNLPRRLILDFKDVFGKGLYFQSMQGNFTLKNGDAYTDEFKIDASGAKIVVSGRTGLAKQDYDQTITVIPGVSKILPTIGAITGGAVGAAAGFIVQGMFGKGLKNVTRIVYKVTGSWDNPKIELIEAQEKNNEK